MPNEGEGELAGETGTLGDLAGVWIKLSSILQCDERTRRPFVACPPTGPPPCVQDKAASDSTEPFCDLMQLGMLLRTALR
jgi:hypothetical protein